MSLLERLKEMWRRHDERLVQEGLDARAAESVRIPPGLVLGGRGIGADPTAVQQAGKDAAGGKADA